MTDIRYFFACAHEQFPPDDLLKQAVEAEEAGFDGLACSDHFQPWWEPGESGHAWVWLGAVGQATSRGPLGTAGTPAGAARHGGHTGGRALPPGGDRADGHDPRAAQPWTRVPRRGFRRVAERVAR